MNILIPENCPSCNFLLQMKGEYLVCINTKNCKSQICGAIANWVKELNILELGDALIEKLVTADLVSTPADLYTLKEEDLSSLERMGEKSAANVINAIWKRNPISLDIFLGALSIPMIGGSTIRLLMGEGYNTLEKIKTMTVKQMENIKGIGQARAQSLFDGMKRNEGIMSELIENGLKIESKKESKVVGKLSGKSFVFTGKANRPRKELAKLAEDAGGTVHSSVTKGTSYLVIADPSSVSTKATAARRLGTEVISEEDFIKMAE